MVKAVWNGAILAESDRTIVIDGKHYFPPDAINREYFYENIVHSYCPCLGMANYFNVRVGNKLKPNAAWYYPQPGHAAQEIAGYITFWQGVRVED